MKRIIAFLKGVQYKYLKIWYNRSIWMDKEKYPIIYDSTTKYINPNIGNKVIMGHTRTGKPVYYTITNITRSRGGDWFYDSDAYNVDLVFSHFGNAETPVKP